MSIPSSFIQDLLARADIVDVVGRFVPLKKGGANFMGLCPFHAEKSPSFSVSPAKQFYHCFGCGKTGNAIGFLMEHSGMGFVEAVEDLAQQYGLQVPEGGEKTSPQERARAAQLRVQQHTLSSVLEKAAVGYSKALRQSELAIGYLKARGVSGQTAKTFGLGFAPEGWRGLAGIFADYSDPMLVESGLVIASESAGEDAEDAEDAEAGDLQASLPPPGASNAKRYDRFRCRLMFPIRNSKGECIGFGGRVLHAQDKPKYLNSPETPVFSKGRELYGLFEARTALREHGFALVTEGYMDVVALAQHGYANAVATLGTACTFEHLQKLFRSTSAVVFSFDGDAAGRRAAHKALEVALPFATDTRSIKFLFLPAEHDPDSFIRAEGKAAFSEYIKQALPLSRFLLQAASANCDLLTAEGRAYTASRAQPLWALLPEGTLRHQMLGEIAEQVLMDSRELLAAWQPALTKAAAQAARRAKNQGNARKLPGLLAPTVERELPPPAGSDGQAAAAQPHENASFASADDYLNAGAGSSVVFPEQGRQGWPSTKSTRVAGRMLPASRVDRLLRLLLAESALWERLSSSEQHLLVDLPAPHGPLLVWLESHLHEHGPQPWSQMQAALNGHPHQAYAMAQLSQIPEGVQPDWQELRGIVTLLQRLNRQEEIALLAARAPLDPGVLERLRSLLIEDQAEQKK